MSNIKHKLFKIKILNDDKKDFDEKTLKVVDDFLNESNNVYINHSVTTITENIEKYGQIMTSATYLIVSLIYKDLLQTEFNLSSTKNKTKTIVHKQIIENSDIAEPIIETDFDKEIKKIEILNSITLSNNISNNIKKGNFIVLPTNVKPVVNKKDDKS